MQIIKSVRALEPTGNFNVFIMSNYRLTLITHHLFGGHYFLPGVIKKA